MDLRLATPKGVSFYMLHSVSTLNQCRKFSCVTVVCKNFARYQDYLIAGSNPAEAVGFFGRKNPQHAFLRRRSKTVCPMSQICAMWENPAIYVEVGITGQIDRSFLAQFHPSLTEVSYVAWRESSLEMTGGTKGVAQRALDKGSWLTTNLSYDLSS
jgi:hypothetical protein